MTKSLQILFSVVVFCVSSTVNATFSNPLTVNEIYDSQTQIGAYSVTNNSSFDIFAFAVGSNTSVYATTDYRNFWAANVLDETTWNTGDVYLGHPDLHTANYSFQNYFPGYAVANVYNVIDDFLIQSGETTGYHFFYSALSAASPYIAFYIDGNGNIGAFTGQASVPAPGAAVLFATGLIGLLRFKKNG